MLKGVTRFNVFLVADACVDSLILADVEALVSILTAVGYHFAIRGIPSRIILATMRSFSLESVSLGKWSPSVRITAAVFKDLVLHWRYVSVRSSDRIPSGYHFRFYARFIKVGLEGQRFANDNGWLPERKLACGQRR